MCVSEGGGGGYMHGESWMLFHKKIGLAGHCCVFFSSFFPRLNPVVAFPASASLPVAFRLHPR